MRYIKIVLVSAFVLGLTQISRAQHIAGSKHDFSNATTAAWNSIAGLQGTATSASSTVLGLAGQVCAPCHAPHNALLDGSNNVLQPLWQHKMSAVSNYVMYSGYNMKATMQAQPDGNSKLCLSCHDGTVALQAYVANNMTPSNPTYMTGANLSGTNLSNNHPISFTYNTALLSLDAGVRDPSVALSGMTTSGTIAADMLDHNNEMQCTSCHNAHNTSGAPHMLVVSNTGSALCLTCHNK